MRSGKRTKDGAARPSNASLWASTAAGAHHRLMTAMREPSPPGHPRFTASRLAKVSHRLFDMANLERAVHELDARTGDSKDSLQRAYGTLRCLGPWRPLAPAPSALNFDELRYAFGNFSKVIDFIEEQMMLSSLGTSQVAWAPPILLAGDPGVGKTALAARLAAVIGTTFEEISLAGTTASFTISGMSSGWAGGKAGRIFQSLAWNGFANPIVLLDEIDKAGGDHRFDVGNSLLSLLERHSASRFIDEFIELPVDASRILWVGTCNDLDTISRPLLSRMQVFHIDAPDKDQGRRIAQSVYDSLRASSDWGHRFAERLPQEVADMLATLSPRAQNQALIHAVGQAARCGRTDLHLGDFDAPVRPVRRIGF